MISVNSCFPTNEALLSLREAYGLSEEYEKAYPEDFPKVLALIQSYEDVLQSSKEREESSKKLFKTIEELVESNRELHRQVNEMAELDKKNTQALQKLAKSSSEMKEMTSNIANIVSICANRIFNPVKNGLQSGFYFLTGHREPAAVLPRENQLAIEYPIDPTNPSSIDEKKKRINLLKFCMVVGGLYLLYSKAQRILCYLSAKE